MMQPCLYLYHILHSTSPQKSSEEIKHWHMRLNSKYLLVFQFKRMQRNQNLQKELHRSVFTQRAKFCEEGEPAPLIVSQCYNWSDLSIQGFQKWLVFGRQAPFQQRERAFVLCGGESCWQRVSSTLPFHLGSLTLHFTLCIVRKYDLINTVI